MFFMKLKALLSVAAGYVVSFQAPVQPFLILVVVLVGVDLYTGIKAAKHAGRYKNSKASEGWRRTVNKIVLYFIAILLSEGFVQVFAEGVPYFPPLTYIVAFYICSIEFKSNLENISEVTGVDLWLAVRDKIKDLFPGRSKPKDE